MASTRTCPTAVDAQSLALPGLNKTECFGIAVTPGDCTRARPSRPANVVLLVAAAGTITLARAGESWMVTFQLLHCWWCATLRPSLAINEQGQWRRWPDDDLCCDGACEWHGGSRDARSASWRRWFLARTSRLGCQQVGWSQTRRSGCSRDTPSRLRLPTLPTPAKAHNGPLMAAVAPGTDSSR